MYRVKQLIGAKLSLRNYNAQVGEALACRRPSTGGPGLACLNGSRSAVQLALEKVRTHGFGNVQQGRGTTSSGNNELMNPSRARRGSLNTPLSTSAVSMAVSLSWKPRPRRPYESDNAIA